MLITELNELRRELKVLKLNAQRGPQLRSDSSVKNIPKEIESSYSRINELQLELERKDEQVKELKRMVEDSAERGKDGPKLCLNDKNYEEKLKEGSNQPIDTSDGFELAGSMSQLSEDNNARECSILETDLEEPQPPQPERLMEGLHGVSEHDQGNVQVEAIPDFESDHGEPPHPEIVMEEKLYDQDLVPTSD